MNEMIDQIINSVEFNALLDTDSGDEAKMKVSTYIATLSSAGQHDPERLAEYGLAYLHELHRGPDPRYTGC